MTLFRNVGNFLFFYTITWGPHHCEPYVDAKERLTLHSATELWNTLRSCRRMEKITFFFCLYRNLEVLKEGFELILGSEASVGEETINVTPFVETAIIEELEVVGNDEGYNMIS